ncbi:hypothetical protein FQN52_003407 [Onygenales sp. PD_12]|nr:hypothetical protein FQN53_005460 [Emmonsiellopsis sp. PD_33]KAK2792472.1 hypothetical protein FQN52_003407 [Onygenales sp. PD_12]KAK2805152.1 hypothetical protein FQN51_000675 [Onygenales sp. PD_10]
MHFFPSFLLALAAIGAQASPINHLRDATSPASPITAPRDISPPLVIRQKEGDGNTQIDISKSEIRWGNQPPWDVIHQMHDECDVAGCAAEFRKKTTIVYDQSSKRDMDLIIATGPSRYDDWLKRGLVELLEWVLEREGVVRIEREKAWVSPCSGFQCQATKVEKHDQYYATRRIQIEYTHEDGHQSVMQFDVRKNGDEVSKEGCKDTWGAVGAFGGLASAFGGLFSLLGLACGD